MNCVLMNCNFFISCAQNQFYLCSLTVFCIKYNMLINNTKEIASKHVHLHVFKYIQVDKQVVVLVQNIISASVQIPCSPIHSFITSSHPSLYSLYSRHPNSTKVSIPRLLVLAVAHGISCLACSNIVRNVCIVAM